MCTHTTRYTRHAEEEECVILSMTMYGNVYVCACESEFVETEVEKDLGMLGTSAQAVAKGVGDMGVFRVRACVPRA